MPLRIENAIDLHCHFGPDTIGPMTGAPPPEVADSDTAAGHGAVTAFESAREALASGHRAIVLKSHSFCSAQLAENLREAVPGLTIFGGGCTDYCSGGLSIQTVETALMLGARIIWLPTLHSCQDARHRPPGGDWPKEGIPVLGDDGELLPVVRDVFALVRQYDAVLATGHTTAAEHHAVVKAFAGEGKVVVTHAGEAMGGPNLSAAQAKELADMGATIELTANCCAAVLGRPAKSPRQMLEMIAAIGHERCTLSSDYGWSRQIPKPVAGFKEFLEHLWDAGMSEAELSRMASVNPAALLSLD